MTTTVTMPQLGESVTEGTLAKWLKQTGDPVALYESIAEVVTDKVNAEIPSPVKGAMGTHIIEEGTVVAVGEQLCTIEDDATSSVKEEQSSPAPEMESAQGETSVPENAEPESVSDSTPDRTTVAEDSASLEVSPAGTNEQNTGAAIHTSPVVKLLAREHGVDLSKLQGTGIAGRITKNDVLGYISDGSGDGSPSGETIVQPANDGKQTSVASAELTTASPELQAEQVPVSSGSGTSATKKGKTQKLENDQLVELTSVRKAIAEHMTRSWTTSPHAWFMVEVNMNNVSHLRSQLSQSVKEHYGVELTYLPFVARATIAALQQHPSMNATWTDEGILEHQDIHLGIAVALEDNLIVPVIRNADQLSLSGLAVTMADLGNRARTNKLKVDEIQGGTFTLNNTGALGTILSKPIINQPQAAIVAMDRVVKRAVVIEGDAIAVRPMMNLCISFDHRLNDGLQAARFIGAIKTSLEQMDEESILA